MDKQEKFQELALERAIKILSKKRITSKDYHRLEMLTKIIFDVNSYNLQMLTVRLNRSRSVGRVSQDLTFQQKSKENLAD